MSGAGFLEDAPDYLPNSPIGFWQNSPHVSGVSPSAEQRRNRGSLWHVGGDQQRPVAAGAVMVDPLLAILSHAKAPGRGAAASALGEIGDERAPDLLLAAVAAGDEALASTACHAAIVIGGKRCTVALIAHLAAGTSQDGRIALFLRQYPSRAALAAIDAALLRVVDRHERTWLEEARQRCENLAEHR